jgi:hypothetical protein
VVVDLDHNLVVVADLAEVQMVVLVVLLAATASVAVV